MRRYSKILGLVIILFIIVLIVRHCSSAYIKTSPQLVTVKAESITNPLYYSGQIQSGKNQVIPSPVDGVVVDTLFQYGQVVKQGQLLFLISSTKFLSDYKTALMQYVKAKNEFDHYKGQLSEGKFLHQHQLISDDDYKMKESGFYAAQLSFLESKEALETLMKQIDNKAIDYTKLTIADIDKLTQAIHTQLTPEHYLRITSPCDGVILSPAKNGEENKKISKGDFIKQGDVLALIGDRSSLLVNIKVNELTVNQLHVGQKVNISGIAFSEDHLAGVISALDYQGESSGNAPPTFPVNILVKGLTSDQQHRIHIGMSANVEILADESKVTLIPLNAIIEKNGAMFVRKYNESDKKFEEVAVKTGKTTLDSVTILAGVKPGDKIATFNQA